MPEWSLQHNQGHRRAIMSIHGRALLPDAGCRAVFQELVTALGVPLLPVLLAAIPHRLGRVVLAKVIVQRGIVGVTPINEECQPFIQYLTSWNQKSAMAAMRMAAVLARTHSYFVSYSHEHMDAADHFELLLTRVGRVFHRDENELVLGKAVKEGLRPQIASADTFLALWSAPAAKSKWCDWERKTALELMKGTGKPRRIVFVQLDGTSVPALFKKNLHIKGATRIERVAAMRKLLDSEPLG